MDCNQSCWHKCHNFARWSYKLKWKWNCPRAKGLHTPNIAFENPLPRKAILMRSANTKWHLDTGVSFYNHLSTKPQNDQVPIHMFYSKLTYGFLFWYRIQAAYPLIYASVYHGWCSMLQVAEVSHPFRNCSWQHWNWWCWDGSEGPWKPWITKQNPQDKKLIPNLWHTSLL